ncbi:protein preli-like [Hyalella azteca]|uniref:Protein preli-like n=1 Tax=Hyalella azteca TaxID=294128 RepID=A0A8B7PLY3_HYAAZ|nr:protein preli-like [Hyalella azteca]
MRYCEDSSLFHYKWEQVAQALWLRYPNPSSGHVLSEDTIARRVENGKLHSTRVIVKTNRMPKWAERIVTARKVAVVERSTIDPASCTIETVTTNVGLTKFMTCVEHVTYRPCDKEPGATVTHRKVWINSKIFGLGYAIQKFGVERYKKNINLTDQGLTYVLAKLFPNPANHDLTSSVAQDTKTRLMETAHRAKLLLDKEKTRMATACGEPNA